MVKTKVVKISNVIDAPISDCYNWFYHSENFIASPIVFKSQWGKAKHGLGSERDIVMIAGWYHEKITDLKKNNYIRYCVERSFPRVKQDFTEILFKKISSNKTQIIWTIEIGMPNQFLLRLASKIAKTLYSTIIMAAQKNLEK